MNRLRASLAIGAYGPGRQVLGYQVLGVLPLKVTAGMMILFRPHPRDTFPLGFRQSNPTLRLSPSLRMQGTRACRPPSVHHGSHGSSVRRFHLVRVPPFPSGEGSSMARSASGRPSHYRIGAERRGSNPRG